MIGLNDVRSLVVKRRSRLLDNLDCVSFFFKNSVLHFCIYVACFNFCIFCSCCVCINVVFLVCCNWFCE